MRAMHWLNWLLVVTGLWELLSPFILGYSAMTAALWNAIVVGFLLIVLAGWTALSSQDLRTVRGLDWINALAGLWLVLFPFIWSYTATVAVLWNSIIVGVVVIVLAVLAAIRSGRPAAPQS
jgi:hypothetical protein